MSSHPIKFNDIVYCVSQINTPIAYQVIALSESQALCQIGRASCRERV